MFCCLASDGLDQSDCDQWGGPPPPPWWACSGLVLRRAISPRKPDLQLGT